MVELEEINVEVEPCPARTRAVFLQKRFQKLIGNIIKDTHDTFSSLMEDLDKSQKPVKKLPILLPQTSDRFHCQLVRRSWDVPKLSEGRGNAGNGIGDCFDTSSMSASNVRESCSQKCGSLDEGSLHLSNMDREEYEASERLKRLIEEELCSRGKEMTDRSYVLHPSRTGSHFGADLGEDHPSYSHRRPNTTHSNFETFREEYPTSTQRLDSLIKDELNRMKISVDVAENELNRINTSVDVSKDDNPLPVNCIPRPKIWANILETPHAAGIDQNW